MKITKIQNTIYKLQNVKLQYIVLILLCFIAFFLRSYAIYRDLVFGYDQGRDAIQMQKIAAGDFTLIGPVTGLDGVFLGPFWYYLIFPAYMLGQGNPVVAGYEMILFSVGTIVLLYLWGRKLSLPWAGLLAATVYTFSFKNILLARWVSNPTPLPFFALMAFYLLWSAIEKKKWILFLLAGVVFGLCIQLEAANATWYLPTTALILLVTSLREKRQQVLSFLKSGMLLAIGFIAAESPHLLFELKHNFLITRNILISLQKTHDVTLLESLPRRIPLLFRLYGEPLFMQNGWIFACAGVLLLIGAYVLRRQLWSKTGSMILLLWLAVPFFFHTIYTGNHGNFWDYYIIAQHPALYLLASYIGVLLYRTFPAKRVIIATIGILLISASVVLNLHKWTEIIQPYEDRYSLERLVAATNWMIDESNGEPYGVWVYAPNAQDEPHRYVYGWIGKKRGVYPEEHVEQQPIIYLDVEDDPVYWKRHKEWIEEKLQFGTLLESKKFGAITVYKIKNTFIGQERKKPIQ